MPDITVIIPNYNHARFLDRRIGSVLDQTRQDFEVLFLDDKSTDDSLRVFAKYQGDPRVRAILNETNSGSTFHQWNKGVAEARGRYIWIAESDDYAAPDLLETLVGLHDRQPGLAIAYCESRMVDEDDRDLGIATDYVDEVMPMDLWEIDRDRWRRDFVADGRRYCFDVQARLSSIPNASAVVFRREAFLAAGGADPSYRGAGDWLVWGRMMLHGGVGFVARPMNAFRSHVQTTRQRFKSSDLSFIEALRIRVGLVNDLRVPFEERGLWADHVASHLHCMALSPRFAFKYNVEAVRLAREFSPSMARELGITYRAAARCWAGRTARKALAAVGLHDAAKAPRWRPADVAPDGGDDLGRPTPPPPRRGDAATGDGHEI